MDTAFETPFRTAFACFWLLNTGIRSYFQTKALRARKASDVENSAGRPGFRVLALVYLLLIVYSVTTWVDFAHVDLSSWLRWTFGGGLLLIYLALFVWAHQVLGKHWSGILELHEDHSLITSGPYRMVRHPMYSAFFLSGLGIFILTANWFLSSLYFLAVAYMYFSRVSAEEELMIGRFGDAYREYMTKTARLVPRLLKRGRSRDEA